MWAVPAASRTDDGHRLVHIVHALLDALKLAVQVVAPVGILASYAAQSQAAADKRAAQMKLESCPMSNRAAVVLAAGAGCLYGLTIFPGSDPTLDSLEFQTAVTVMGPPSFLPLGPPPGYLTWEAAARDLREYSLYAITRDDAQIEEAIASPARWTSGDLLGDRIEFHNP